MVTALVNEVYEIRMRIGARAKQSQFVLAGDGGHGYPTRGAEEGGIVQNKAKLGKDGMSGRRARVRYPARLTNAGYRIWERLPGGSVCSAWQGVVPPQEGAGHDGVDLRKPCVETILRA